MLVIYLLKTKSISPGCQGASIPTPPFSTKFNHAVVLGCLMMILSPIARPDTFSTSIVLLPAGM
jgi:hypothetical protein